MSYSAYLNPRQETLSQDGIEGIIDLANLSSRNSKKIEANPELFFELTYPTSDIFRVLEQLHIRFEQKKDTSELFLFEGLKGSGKSHLLLLVHNLLKHPEIASIFCSWFDSSGFTFLHINLN
jgi:predicted AAA+ superfamily ATPase